ncbi:MAG: hypothetical protein KGH72_01615 [Candidatus Micrarchaeota archaeon]|nr:hypothetical protein [Candidatus Micrarchaeota archaeon]
MVAVLGRQIRGRNELDRVIAQEKRPIIIDREDEGRHSHDAMRLRILRRDGIGAVEEATGEGFTFAFSAGSFNMGFGSNGNSGEIGNVHAAALPGGTRFRIEHSELLYIGSVSTGAQRGGELRSPIGFTMPYIMKHLENGKANKMVVPEQMNGDVKAAGGERVHRQSRKHVVVGPENQEFSAGNARSPQQFHVHMSLVEAYIPMGGMDLYYVSQGRVERVRMEPGDIAVLPSGVPHFVEMFGDKPTFVLMASARPIKGDKFLLPFGLDTERMALTDSLIGAVR